MQCSLSSYAGACWVQAVQQQYHDSIPGGMLLKFLDMPIRKAEEQRLLIPEDRTIKGLRRAVNTLAHAGFS